MKNRFLLLWLILWKAPLFSQQLSPPQIHYTIRVNLDDRHHSLNGSLDLQYTNPSSDTLRYLWFQLWPNAYKNDRTAYSEQMLDSGRNDFYFSDKQQKGYINRLVFTQGNQVLALEDHPSFIDITKVYLAAPLPPGKMALVGATFHVQLPYNFSGFGHVGQSYSLLSWYPVVAPFESGRWLPQPFTGQQQQSTADYDVSVTLPCRFNLRTNGQLLDSTSIDTMRTMHYEAAAVNDFTWSAEPAGTRHPAARKKIEDQVDDWASALFSRKILPLAGYNLYDGLQLGVLTHNLGRSSKKWSWYAAPMFATGSKKVTGFAGLDYLPSPGNYFSKIKIGVDASRFSSLKAFDSTGTRIYGGFYKVAPYIRLTFPTANKHVEEWVEFKTLLIGERDFDYRQYSVDSFYYPAEANTVTRYLNQVTVSRASFRSLYPYDAQLQLQQASTFFRLNAEAHYLFNYAGGGGMRVRAFAAKFGYIGHSGSGESFRYQPKLTAVRGDEDYTYGNPFLGRNEFDGMASRQIMMRDGGFKLRTDLFQDLQGRSDNWIASVNLNTTLPNKIFPAGFPLRLFLDAGTYAGAWDKGSALPRFLYVAGLQVSVLKDLFNIYAPLMYSKTFGDNLKTVPEQNSFLKRISFSIDTQRFSRRSFKGNRSGYAGE